jgi:CBS domain-containing protein
MYKNQQLDLPVYKWDLAEVDIKKMSNRFDKIYRIMTTELFVVNENDLVELVAKIMEWKSIHHLPVVNEFNKITGLITKSNLIDLDIQKTKKNFVMAKDIMVKKVISVGPETLIEDANKIMIKNNIGCLPVIDGDELIGIFTKNDLQRIDKYSKINE